MTLKHPKCLMGGVVVEQAEAALAGVADPFCPVQVELIFDPPWTPDRITAEGRRLLGSSG